MPSFTTTYSNLVSEGPIVTVTILPPRQLLDAMTKMSLPSPSPIEVRALIDTGATCTAVNPAIISQLQLSPIGTTKISTPSCFEVLCNTYHIGIIFTQGGAPIVIETPSAIEVPLIGQNIQCLIGRDILSLGVFIYNGYARQITLSF